MTKPNENWQERNYEAFTPNVKLDCNNPQEGFSGPIVYNMLASSKGGQQSSYGMTEGGLFHIYNDQCIEIVGGKKVGGGGVCLNIVGSSGDVWITALSNGDVRVTGTNIMLDAARDLTINAGSNFSVKANKINMSSNECYIKAPRGKISVRDVSWSGTVFSGTSVPASMYSWGKNMTDFKGGGIPVPDYDKEDINFVSQKTEFTDDVFVYGKLYAELGGDVQTFSTAGVERVSIDKDGQVTINSGDIVVGTDNKGLSFVNSSSTPDTDSTSNTRVITDYDEGTCDWELHRSDGLTTGTIGTTTNVTYTKIGNRVFMSGYLRTNGSGGTTGVTARLTDASGNAASLPYTPNHSGGMPISHTRTLDEFERMSVSFASGSKTVYVHTDQSNNNYTPNQNNVTISSTQTAIVLAFNGSYKTNE